MATGASFTQCSWSDPSIEWRGDLDFAAQQHWLAAHGEWLVTWPAAPFEDTPTDCYRTGHDYWIWQPGIGGVSFPDDRPHIVGYPSPHGNVEQFQLMVARCWLPVIYQVWGQQVLHASAATNIGTGTVVAFSGPSHAGKSTFAFGLGQRPGWRPLCDDMMAFSSAGAGISLRRLASDVRLRSASTTYFAAAAESAPLAWPTSALSLRAVYYLQGDPTTGSTEITRLTSATSYPLLLEQAYAMTLALPHHNQRLLRDYLALVARVAVFRLVYPKTFDAFEQVLDAVEDHLRATAGTAPASASAVALRT
jgi:hypothetical protein